MPWPDSLHLKLDLATSGSRRGSRSSRGEIGAAGPWLNSSPTGVAPVLQLHPSRLCNIACAHCYSGSGPTVREELPLELLSDCLEDAAALGYRQLGGLRWRAAALRPLPGCSPGPALGMLTTITTNGMLLTPRRWEPIATLVDVLAISIDGTPAEHDRIRRRDGAFARTSRTSSSPRVRGARSASSSRSRSTTSTASSSS